ncbi:hypothetical protein LCGC14_1122430, partial [marine sediment metagenome]
LEDRHILQNLEISVPLATFMKEQIEDMRSWAKKRTRPASKSENILNKTSRPIEY